MTIVLCADQEARLLPTVRSRCFRLRLGLVGPRDIEAIVADHGVADPPTAARLGRLAGGRPGVALAYARAPDARAHPGGADARPARPDRRPSVRPPGRGAGRDPTGHRARRGARRRRDPDAPPPRCRSAACDAAAATAGGPGARPTDRTRRRPSRRRDRRRRSRRSVAARRPSAAGPSRSSLGLWADVARDLVLVADGGARSVHDTVLLEELAAIAAAVDDRCCRGVPRAGRPRRRVARVERLPGTRPRRAGAGLAAARRGRLTYLRHDGRRCGSRHASGRDGQRPRPGRRLPLFRAPRGDGPRARRLGGEHAGRLRPLRRRGLRARGSRRFSSGSTKGPSSAIVDRVSVAWMPATGTSGRSACGAAAIGATERLTRTDGSDRTAGLFRVRAGASVILTHDGAQTRRRGAAALYRAVLDRVAELEACRPTGTSPTGSEPRRSGSTPGRGTSRPGETSWRCSGAMRTLLQVARSFGRSSPSPDRPRRPDDPDAVRGGVGYGRCPPRPSAMPSNGPWRVTPRSASSARRSRTSGRTSPTWSRRGATRLDAVAETRGDEVATGRGQRRDRSGDRRDRTDRPIRIGPSTGCPPSRRSCSSLSARRHEVPGRGARRPGRRLRRHPGGSAGRPDRRRCWPTRRRPSGSSRGPS